MELIVYLARRMDVDIDSEDDDEIRNAISEKLYTDLNLTDEDVYIENYEEAP